MSLKFHRWLHRKGLSRRRLRDSRMVKWLGDWIHAREYWVPTRESLARGWLIGALSACSPFMGAQILMALPFALFFHANIPLILFLILLTNPITAAPYYYAAYELGSFVLGLNSGQHNPPPEAVTPPDLPPLPAIDQSWHVTDSMLAVLVGCAIIGVTIGVVGYLLIHLFWKPKPRSRPLAPLVRAEDKAKERTGVGAVDTKP